MIIFLYNSQNLLLDLLKSCLFGRRRIPPGVKRVLIFRTGNIGDIVCAVPSIFAIRKNFPDARIVLVSSPGAKGGIGAEELLRGADFLNDLLIYYNNDIKDLRGKLNLVRRLRSGGFDFGSR